LGTGEGSLAEARGQLALGNPGLALEGFRKVLRTQGDSPDAFAGIAASYAAMGRNDLARSNYEAALALAPHKPSLLLAEANALESLGRISEAAEARAEAQQEAAVPSPRPLIPSAKAPSTRLAATIIVDLPPPRAVEHVRAQNISSALAAVPHLSARAPQAVEPERLVATAPTRHPSALPRLERLSMGEVQLVTTPKPVWRAQLVSRTRLSTTVRWEPIQTADGRQNIKILNAARSAGLADRSRGMLIDRGWRRIEIGDAPQVRAKTLVIYPASRSTLGRSLAAQFGCASRRGEGDLLVVLLGRDRAGPNSTRTTSIRT
jgi:hypothetical protein